jgi:hypothetical protein
MDNLVIALVPVRTSLYINGPTIDLSIANKYIPYDNDDFFIVEGGVLKLSPS